MHQSSALYDPRRVATPSQRLAAAAHHMRRAKIRAKAIGDAPPTVVTFEIPNTPFGVAKVRPGYKPTKAEPAVIHRMWFEDLILEAERHLRKPRVPDVLKATAFHFGLSQVDLLKGGRTKDLVLPRHIAMFLAYRLTDLSLPDIGRRFGGYDHTSILHGRDRIRHLIKSDIEVARHVDVIIRSIPGASVIRNG
jgi:hypothetical protein